MLNKLMNIITPDTSVASSHKAAIDVIKKRVAFSPQDHDPPPQSEKQSVITAGTHHQNVHLDMSATSHDQNTNDKLRDKRQSFGRPARPGGGGGSNVSRRQSMSLSLQSGFDLADIARSAFAVSSSEVTNVFCIILKCK